MLMFARIRDTRENESGFTLIELLIVIVILGVLAGIVTFSVSGISDRGKTSACAATVKTVKVAGEAYYAKNGTYAANTQALVDAGFLQAPTPAPADITYATVAASGSTPAKLTVTGAACP
jgi:prepilin-type N-terminal cleavage/methylation domain-containing protein